MLDKELCKKCWGNDWNKGDDSDWEDGGFINCRSSTHMLMGQEFCDHISIGDEPPVGCHMALEYAVLKQEYKDE